MKFDKWIFVTGAPRSGTSFVGRILARPYNVDLIFEPTDPKVGMSGIDRRYIYLRPDTDDTNNYAQILRRIFTYEMRYRPSPLWPSDNWVVCLRKRLIGPRGAPYLWAAKWNPFHDCAIVKDPDGCLLTEYFYARYGVRPVVCVRHPAAFVASYLHHQFGWDLPALTGQPELIADYFSDRAGAFNVDPADRVAGAAVLWWALNRVLMEQCSRHPDWIVLVHEELCRAPVETFRTLFDQLGLPWSSGVARVIERRTGAHNKVEARAIHDHRRNSAALFELRRGALSAEDRAKIFEITQDVALQVYSKDSFGLEEDGPAYERVQVRDAAGVGHVGTR